MFAVTLYSSLFALALSASGVLAQDPPSSTYPAVPLAQKRFDSPDSLPEKVDTDVGLIRGTQKGYNKCDKTTEGQDSLCQTMYFNSIDDFCLWAPPETGKEVGSIEGEMVAWCTKPGHGTRLIPAGALKGVQWMKTPDYVQAVGFLDQTLLNMTPDDFGGEMDPHGADLRGNPMGGVVFSNAYNGKYQQAVEWHNFIGSNAFCFKACDPNGPNAAHFCEHVFDRIGCAYNAPNNAQKDVFESCQGDNQDFPGVYTVDGKAVTYTQPPESLGAISSMPYTARVPQSSSCVTYTSSVLYAAAPTVSTSAATTTTAATSSGSKASTTSKSTAAATTSGAAGSSTSAGNGASIVAMSGVSLFGIVFAALFFA
ncbi:hypothetical protein D9611_009623 [Ephemerocybe angulata]|uniref:Macrofage activating glycoprotein n=1 Tax=Ephemerocybe angulata TaxID=980116 RepID=A0A8H5C6R0_9AGAR|nr:hypothetical protein D9611_009623 [Tulosesus angulatus]